MAIVEALARSSRNKWFERFRRWIWEYCISRMKGRSTYPQLLPIFLISEWKREEGRKGSEEREKGRREEDVYIPLLFYRQDRLLCCHHISRMSRCSALQR